MRKATTSSTSKIRTQISGLAHQSLSNNSKRGMSFHKEKDYTDFPET